MCFLFFLNLGLSPYMIEYPDYNPLNHILRLKEEKNFCDLLHISPSVFRWGESSVSPSSDNSPSLRR